MLLAPKLQKDPCELEKAPTRDALVRRRPKGVVKTERTPTTLAKIGFPTMIAFLIVLHDNF
jgi:hypothetical protein